MPTSPRKRGSAAAVDDHAATDDDVVTCHREPPEVAADVTAER